MARVIKESYILEATNTDVLAAPSRLAAVPRNGTLTIELSSSVANASNHFLVTLQLPDGDIPLEDVVVPFSGQSGGQAMDDRTKLMIQVAVRQGGHVGLSLTEVGASACLVFATLAFP